MTKERRKFKRFDAFMNVQCRSQQASVIETSGLSKDLSREGIKVSTDRSLETGTLVDLEIQLPDEVRPVRSTGKIMWSKANAREDRGYESGVNFLLIDPVDKFRILDYAYNYWLETKVNDFSDPEELSELA